MNNQEVVKYPEPNELWVNKEEYARYYGYCYILKIYGNYISYLKLDTYGNLKIEDRVDKFCFVKNSAFVEKRDISIYDLFGIKENGFTENSKMIKEKIGTMNDIKFQCLELRWNSKWYHYIYYWFYNRWQKYIKKSDKWIGCCKGNASRPLKAKFTVEFVSDIDENKTCEIGNQMIDNLTKDLQKDIDDTIKEKLNTSFDIDIKETDDNYYKELKRWVKEKK